MHHEQHFRFSVETFFLIIAGIHLAGFVAFLIMELTPLMRHHVNPLVFLEELDRQRQLGSGKSRNDSERRRLLESGATPTGGVFDDDSSESADEFGERSPLRRGTGSGKYRKFKDRAARRSGLRVGSGAGDDRKPLLDNVETT